MSDFSDDYFSKVRSAIEPKPKTTDRDVATRALQLGDQYQPRADIIESGGTFVAADEWIQCISLQPQQASGIVRLLAEGGGFYTGDEPFYVSGSRIFTVDTGGQVLVQRAVRRELLSRMLARDFAANGAAFVDCYQETFTAPALGVNTNWVYLDRNLTWQLAAIGQTPLGMPFGWGAADKNVAGRYYNVEFGTQDNGNGLTTVYFIASNSPTGLDTTGVGYNVSVNQAAMHGICTVGDETPGSIGSNAPAGVGFQSSMKSARLWTIGIGVNVAGATGPGGFLSVIRRGF